MHVQTKYKKNILKKTKKNQNFEKKYVRKEKHFFVLVAFFNIEN